MKKTIKSKKEFSEVFRNGKRASSKYVRLSALTNEGNPGKVAFVAAKRLGNAPYRNRCKRVLREAARLCELPYDELSIILFATHKTYYAKPYEVAKDIEGLLKKLNN